MEQDTRHRSGEKPFAADDWDELDAYEPLPVPRVRLRLLALLLFVLHLFFITPIGPQDDEWIRETILGALLTGEFDAEPMAEACLGLLMIASVLSLTTVVRLAGMPLINHESTDLRVLTVLGIAAWMAALALGGYFFGSLLFDERSFAPWFVWLLPVFFLLLLVLTVYCGSLVRLQTRALLLGLMPAGLAFLFLGLSTGVSIQDFFRYSYQRDILEVTLFMVVVWNTLVAVAALLLGFSAFAVYRRQRKLEREFQQALGDRARAN